MKVYVNPVPEHEAGTIPCSEDKTCLKPATYKAGVRGWCDGHAERDYLAGRIDYAQEKPAPSALPNAAARLTGALDTICGPRQSEYGHPRDNIGAVAKLWSIIIGHEVSARQVCKMMIALKLARDVTAEAKDESRAKEDNEVDIIGYTALMAEVDIPEE